jgi:predicted RNase H-like HicB family nuclease
VSLSGCSKGMKILIVVEKTGTGYSAYSPDVPGCAATGATRDEVEQERREAITFSLEGLRADGAALPEPHAYATYCHFAA